MSWVFKKEPEEKSIFSLLAAWRPAAEREFECGLSGPKSQLEEEMKEAVIPTPHSGKRRRVMTPHFTGKSLHLCGGKEPGYINSEREYSHALSPSCVGLHPPSNDLRGSRSDLPGSAWPAPDACFQDVNAAGNAYGNCGKDSLGNYMKCGRSNAICGKIQCQSAAKKPKGTNAVPIDTTIRFNGQEVKCRGTFVYATQDGEGDLPDPGLVMTGTKCGEGKACQQGLVAGLLFAFLVLLPGVLGMFSCWKIKTSPFHKWRARRNQNTRTSRNEVSGQKPKNGHLNPAFHLKTIGLSNKPNNAKKSPHLSREVLPLRPAPGPNGSQPVNIVRPLRTAPTPDIQRNLKEVRPVKLPTTLLKSPGMADKLIPPKKPLPVNPARTTLLVCDRQPRGSPSPPQRPLPLNPSTVLAKRGRNEVLVLLPPVSNKPVGKAAVIPPAKPLKYVGSCLCVGRIQRDSFLTVSQLRAKGELNFEQDFLVEGGKIGGLTNGTEYKEVRQFRSAHHLVRFYFLTRVYSKYLESVLADFQAGPQPDVLIVNSCVWDVSRYVGSCLCVGLIQGELNFEQDFLVEGGKIGGLTNGTEYKEVRQFRSAHHLVRFYFLTRVYSKYLESVLADFQAGPQPDVLIVNSCVWDVSRYVGSFVCGELNFEQDFLVEGGKIGGLTNGTEYKEVRQFRSAHHLVRFYFLTRVYSKYLESVLADFQAGPQPDVLIVNVCVWDVSRKIGGLTNGTEYKEVRQFRSAHHLVRFYFLTRVYSKYLESVLADFQAGPQPDVLIVNSCVWDVSRYGPSSMEEYRVNLGKFFTRLGEVLLPECLVMWNMAMPLGKKIYGGFLIPEVSSRCRPSTVKPNLALLNHSRMHARLWEFCFPYFHHPSYFTG
ncbi:UNVERIFIED_CONTAM: hypothetical protein FKN15_067207 [Acipenser sinensis]